MLVTIKATPNPGTSVWYETATPRAPLTGNIEADVAIVGGGYTGLWTAYYLLKADPSLRVVIIEREYVGYGASGRNGGWASAIFPLSLHRVAKTSSRQLALALQKAMNETIDEIGSVLLAEQISADFAKEGFLSLARSTAQLARAKAMVRSWEDFGLPAQWQLVNANGTRGLVSADTVEGALFTAHCALVHPGKLVRGLAATAERLGAGIFESTTAIRIEPGRIATNRGRVRAPIVVRATEGFTPSLKAHRRTLVPLYSLVLATEPIPLLSRIELGINHRMAFNDMRHLRVYAQVTRDGRLVFGGRGAPYHFGSKVVPEYDRANNIHAKLHAAMIDFFPPLRNTSITHRWGGPLGVPRDWHPSVGLDPTTGMAWAGSYIGDGVATSNLAARVLRNLILEQPDDINILPIVNHQSPRWEPEPLRWLGVNLGLRAAALADFEERITKRSSGISRLLESITGAH